MKSAHIPFRREIANNPKSLEARLIYADWLEERGNPLGEFIRTQIALGQGSISDRDRNLLESRELQLLRQFQKGWVRNIRPFVERWQFRNGSVEGIEVSAAGFLEHRRQLFQDSPIRDCKLSSIRDHLRPVAETTELTQLRSLDLGCEQLGRWGEFETYERERKLIELLTSKHMSQIEHLGLEATLLNDGVLETIGEVGFPKLESLDLSRNVSLTTEGLNGLLSKYPIRRLRVGHTRYQNLTGNWRQESVIAFARAVLSLKTLRDLDLDQRSLRLRLLGHAFDTSQTSLARVSLRGNPFVEDQEFGEEEIVPEDVLRHAHNLLRNADDVNLSACFLRPVVIDGLVPALSAVRSMDLSNNPLGRDGLESIANARVWKRLSHLRFSSLQPAYVGMRRFGRDYYRLDDHAVRMFCESTNLPMLNKLELVRHQLSSTTASRIVEAPWLKQLHYLDLRQNQLSDEGAESFVRFGDWPQLAYLNLRQNGIGNQLKSQLRRTFGYKVLF